MPERFVIGRPVGVHRFLEIVQGRDQLYSLGELDAKLRAGRLVDISDKLLVWERELWEAVRQKGVTVIPLRVYLKEGRAKIEIATAKGKKLYDKREDMARKDAQREVERELRGRE